MRSGVCAWCGASRGDGPTCDKCRAGYERAERIKAGKRASEASHDSPKELLLQQRLQEREERTLASWEHVRDPAFERQLRFCVVPAMLGVALLMMSLGVGKGFLRIVFGMPVHEMAHAVAAWLSGFNAVPTLWKTLIPESRGWVAPVAVTLALGYLINYARMKTNGFMLLLGVTLLAAQIYFTLVIDVRSAHAFVTWSGDGVGMVLATLLMASFSIDK